MSPDVAQSTPSPALPAKGSRFDLDLRAEAKRLVRQSFRVVGTGLALGLAFVGIGAYEVGVHVASGFSPEYLISFLLIVLGMSVIGVSLYSGLLNPVTRLRGDASGVTFERRWGRPLSWSWKNPEFRLDIDDRTSDPVGSAESHQHLFFEGPGPIYGSLTPTTLDRLLDTARTYGVPVSEKQLDQREGGQVHLVRRIRLRPRPTH